MTTITLAKTGCISMVLLILSLTCKAQPHADFTATPVSGCSPLIVNFTDLSGNNPTQWKWDLGNGTISFLQNPSATYFNPGQYTVKLVVQNAAGSDSVTRLQYITVYAQPQIDFVGSPLTGCFPLPVNFTDLSSTAAGTISTWQWDFGDGTSSNLQNPSHIYTATGNYNVSLLIQNSDGCFKTITRTSYVQISNGAHADFSNNVSNSCTAPVNINFQNLSTGTGILTYEWNFGDGTTSTATNPSHGYNNPGSYTVQLIVTNNVGCRDTIIKPNAVSIGDVAASFTTPDSVCVNTPFTLSNTSTPVPVSVLWKFGDGTTSTLSAPVKFYTVAGVYQIKLISNFGACIDSVWKNITVLPKPTGDFSGNMLQSCQVPFTVNFNNTSLNGISYQWNFGDGNTSSQTNPSHTYTSPGNYTVSLITTNVNGCSDTLIKANYIKIKLPQVNINGLPEKGCAPLSHSFSATVNSIEPVTAWHWDFGDGNTSTSASPTHIFSAGVYDIQVIITTASGCTDTAIIHSGIKAGIKPVANFTATPRDVCAHIPVNFNDLSTGTVTEWLWDFGDGSTSTNQNPMHVYEDTGYFNISLIVWNNGCPDTLIIPNYVHVNPPIAAFSVTNDCNDPFKRIFIDHSIGADEWNWDFGDGTTSTQQSPVHVYATTGNYTVTLLVRNHTTGCSYTKTSNERIVDEHADFTASDTAICKGNIIGFTATGFNPLNITSYTWLYGDGGIGFTNPASHNYANPGIYDVSLQITDINGCKDTIVKPQYIFVNGPKANFTASASGSCLLSSIQFYDLSVTDGTHPIVEWTWNYGDGIIETLSSGPFQHTYASPGMYTVTLKVMDNSGCLDSIVKTNLLQVSRPVADFVADTLSCPSKPINFINHSTGPGLSCVWYFGDGTTSTDLNPVHSYSADGIYSVKLVISDQYGCGDSINKINYITIITPVVGFSVSDSAGTCPPLIVNFTNSSQNYTSLNWDFGDGTTSTSQNPSHFYSIPGIYHAKLTINGAGGCTAVKVQTITIKGPQGSFVYGPQSGCKPLQVTFTATTQNRISFVWDFDDGTTIATTDSVITHTYTIAGNYLPKMILKDEGGCVVPITGPDTIKVYGITAAMDFDHAPLCDSGMVQFNNSAASNDIITGYEWDFGDGTSSVLANPLHQYNNTGLYYPSLKVRTQSGCTDSVKSIIPVKIVHSPHALISQSPNGCAPVSITMSGAVTADSSAVTWNWNFGNGHTSIVKDPPAEVYSVSGIYTVSLFVTNSSGCKDTVLTSVNAFAIPTVNAGLDTFVCKGNGRTLHASGAATYTWTPTTGLSCTNCADALATPDSLITYIVQGTSADGCSNKDSVQLTVKKPFKINFSQADTVCKGSSVNMAAIGADNFSWSPSAGLNSTTGPIVTASPLVSTIYQVIGKDNKNCFSDTAFIPIKVFDIPTVEAGPDKTINVGQTIDLVPVISSDVTDVVWSPTGSIFRSDYPSVTVKPRQTTTYDVVVKNAGGCTARDNITVHVLCDGANVFIPNTFSPNGDGANDIFYPRGTGLFNIQTLRIFNRWGEIVYEKREFAPNDANAGWDGTYKGKKLNVDVYVYTIEIRCDNNTILVYKGNVALIQ